MMKIDSWLSIYDGGNKRMFHISNAFAESDLLRELAREHMEEEMATPIRGRMAAETAAMALFAAQRIRQHKYLEQKYNYS